MVALRGHLLDSDRHAGAGHDPGHVALDCGALSNLANPKIAIFYFAFLPQFVAPDAAHPTLQLGALGSVFAASTFGVKAPVGLSAGALSDWLRRRPGVLVWLYRSSGAVLLGLGVRLAFERRT